MKLAEVRPVIPGTQAGDHATAADLRAKITGLELTYVAGIRANTVVRAAADASQAVSVEKLPRALPKRAWKRAWQKIAWREGTAQTLASRFARVRVRVAGGANRRVDGRPEEWLLIEWPKDENKPTKYWLSTLPETIDFAELVQTRQNCAGESSAIIWS